MSPESVILFWFALFATAFSFLFQFMLGPLSEVCANLRTFWLLYSTRIDEFEHVYVYYYRMIL